MKILLDTCSFLWIIEGANELSSDGKKLFTDPDNLIYLSSVSVWELLVKQQLGKLKLPNSPQQFIIEQRKLHRIEPLPLEEDAIAHLLKLPNHHKDPFDRMLVCQAIAHKLSILTPDKAIKDYPITTLW